MADLVKLATVLKEKGLGEAEITQVAEQLTKAAVLQTVAEVINQLEPTDLDMLQKADGAANSEQSVKELFEKRTGRNFDEAANVKLEKVVDEYLQQLD